MSENVAKNFDSREQNNPFQPFSGEEANEVTKYMSLGRSFDSQLGNRLQKICMFLARCRFGDKEVPNYIFARVNSGKIILWLFSYPEKFVAEYGIDAYKTQILRSASSKDDIAKRILGGVEKEIKARYRDDKGIKQIRKEEHKEEVACILEKWENEFRDSIVEYTYDECSADQLKAIKGISKEIPIDLIYFQGPHEVFLYEIKASGGLDTKNRGENAGEVIRNEKKLSFIGRVNSYFAACYNNCGEYGDEIKKEKGVQFRGDFPVGPMFNIVSGRPEMDGKIIVGSVFWEQILPDKITYKRFIEIYADAFRSSEIEKKINEL